MLGVNAQLRKMRVVNMRAWEPEQKTGEVNLQSVEDWCHLMSKEYRPIGVYFDPTEARLMMQRLRLLGVPCRKMTFSSPKNLNRMAEDFIQVVGGRLLTSFDIDGGRMRRDFGKLTILEKTYGYKLEAVRDEFGHADIGTALIIAIPAAVDFLDGVDQPLDEDDVLLETEAEELSREEIKGMPQELREIYELGDPEEDFDDLALLE